MKKYIKYLRFLILIFFVTEPSGLNSQEKKIKKIIIEQPSKERLLSPPIDKKKDSTTIHLFTHKFSENNGTQQLSERHIS